MFGKRNISKEAAALRRQLKKGKRRVAQHDRPRAVTDSGFESFATPANRAVFEGFEYFAAMLNRDVAYPWTIEETPETMVNDLGAEQPELGPELGRTYRIYYNGVRIGSLQVTDGFNLPSTFSKPIEWHREHRAALVLLELQYIRFISYEHAMSLVSAVERYTGSFNDHDEAHFRAKIEATAALTAYLWEVQRVDDYEPSFEHRIEGPYDLSFEVSTSWKSDGFDPFSRSNGNGDRPKNWPQL